MSEVSMRLLGHPRSEPAETATVSVTPPQKTIDGGSGEAHLSAMQERLARLEGAFDGIKVVMAIMMTMMIGGVAFLGVQVTRADSKLSGLSEQVTVLSERVTALPGQINANMRDLTKTLAEVISASRQSPPQIVVMPPKTDRKP